MDKNTKFVEGTCMQMCPQKEIIMRERERLLHRFEMLPATVNDKRPKADPQKAVKSFSRSAAGQNVSSPDNLRPPEVLLQTVNYLLHDVITLDYCEWYKIYDFIMDRLRAVRQDMVVQNVSRPFSISLLQPVIRFYAYSSYRLCEENVSNFDPVINNQHLQECLKRLLVFYDECDELTEKFESIGGDDTDLVDYTSLFLDRPSLEALYLIFNLGNTIAIDRALHLPKRWRVDIVNYCLEMSLIYVRGNWVRVCRMMSKLPSLLAAVASLHLGEIRRQALYKMSFAYNSKNISFPVDLLKVLLLYDTTEEVISDLKLYNVTYDKDTLSVYFTKGSFNVGTERASPRYCLFVDEKLSKRSIPELVLHGDLFF